MTPDVPNLRPASNPRPRFFRVEFNWQGAPLDERRIWIADQMIASFAPDDCGQVRATNDDFVATFSTPPDLLQQLLQCLGVLRAHRIRWVTFEDGTDMDDVTEELEAIDAWSYYPDPERAQRVAEAVAPKKSAPRGAAGRFRGLG
jgi:hypothetical protein